MPAVVELKKLTIKGLLKLIKGLPTYGPVHYKGTAWPFPVIADLRKGLESGDITEANSGLVCGKNAPMIAARVQNARLTVTMNG